MTGEQILIVEDEVIVAKNIQNKLENLGYIVPDIVTTGEEAVEKAIEIRPDLILMDIKLKGEIDGVEAAEQIRRRFDVPIVYLTGYGDNQLLQRAKLTEPYGYILKPFETKELQSNITIALYKSRIENKLRDNEEWLITVLESIGDAVIAVDKEENITFINPMAEQLTGWKRNDALEKNLKKVFNVVDEKTRISEENLADIAIKQDAIVNLENRNVLLLTKDGEERHIDDTAAPIKDHKGNIIGCIIVFRDITGRKQTELELEKHRHSLEKLVENRTADLTKANEKLLQEVTNRRIAEDEANKIKENLQNIIDSAAEVIISIGKDNKLILWNKTAELITGYRKAEIIGKTLKKLPIFDLTNDLSDSIKNIYDGKKPQINEMILKTKNGDNRIIKVSCSLIKSKKDESSGVLFVGSDITLDLESHRRLLTGSSYFIPDKDNKSALDLFKSLNTSNHKGLFITRTTPGIIKNRASLQDCQVILLCQEKLKEFENISSLDDLLSKVKKFAFENPDSIILLDGVHYFITKFSFEKFIDTLYQIIETVSNTNSIMLLRLDPSLLNDMQTAVIENELQLLPNQKLDDVKIDDLLFDILMFIYKQNQNNSEVSFKKISKEFALVSKTVTKRLRMLENEGLIFIKKRGRLKLSNVSQKGKTLLHKRQIV
jgi:PAS domain S-box-containing protein